MTRVTVIPLDSAVPEEDPKLRFLREEAAKVQLDAEVTDAMLKDLPTQRHMSKTALLQGIRSLHWFQTEAQIRVEHLNEYWDLLENVGWDQARGLLPQDLAEIFQLLSVCKRPSTELVRLMSQQCRLLCRTFGAPEVAQVRSNFQSRFPLCCLEMEPMATAGSIWFPSLSLPANPNKGTSQKTCGIWMSAFGDEQNQPQRPRHIGGRATKKNA